MAKSSEWGGTAGENGLGPYAIGVVFALGVFFSTFVFNLFFMNLPVEGEPLEFLDYFKGLPKQHLLGVAGGIIWCAGTIANFVGVERAGSRAGGTGHQPGAGPGCGHGERRSGACCYGRNSRAPTRASRRCC